jgi:cell wall-associated NlpC family hydrolase
MRKLALKIAFKFLGKPYLWGGDDPSGFDCSGYCIEILKSVARLPRKGDWTAAGLARMWPVASNPQPGDLVFWATSSGRIIHVEMCLGKGLAIGASGGSRHTLTYQDAIKQNAYIKIRPILSRPGVWGYVNPFGD